MSIRRDILTNDECYHIFSRSIAGFKIFNNIFEYSRIIDQIDLLRYQNFNYKYSQFIDLGLNMQLDIKKDLQEENDIFVRVIAFCIMPTHFHLILQQKTDKGIANFIGRVLNSYSKFFNTEHKRSGPLWSSRFKSVHIKGDEQLLHLTRYIHLNPSSAGLIENPEDWKYSSYQQYLGKENCSHCDYGGILEIKPKQYKKFVDDRKSYQKDLSIIKGLLIEDYTG